MSDTVNHHDNPPFIRKSQGSKQEMLKRIREVQEWLISGYSPTDIMATGMEKWNVTEREVRTYISKAYNNIKNTLETQDRKWLHIEMLMRLYRDITDKHKSGNAGVALDILQDIAKLQGLYDRAADVKDEPDVITLNLD